MNDTASSRGAPVFDAHQTSPWGRDPESPAASAPAPASIAVGLTAAVLGVRKDQPVVLIRHEGQAGGRHAVLPSCGFDPAAGPALEASLREHVRHATGLGLGYVDQLSADCLGAASEPARLSVGYLALSRVDGQLPSGGALWADCYGFLPWEDFREGRPAVLTEKLLPQLGAWAEAEGEAPDDGHPLSRRDRLRIAFGADGGNWDDERVVDRLEIIREAGIGLAEMARPMRDEHRRILGSALGRLRAKIRQRPVVFELLPPEFTLFELQKTVEAILGPNLHKQNFRRLVEGTRLVEPTGEMRTHTGGRPAKLFRFRHGVLLERPAPGVRIRLGRAS